MNTGLQDAYNLGWKLGLVVWALADESLLDSYENERLPVAERLLSTTDRGFSFIVSDSRLAGLLRTSAIPRLITLAMKLGAMQTAAFRTISQIGIHYPDSPLSETLPDLPKGAPRAGDRFPWLRLQLSADGAVEDLYEKLDDTRFTLVMIGQPEPSGGIPVLEDLLRTIAVPGGPANEAELAHANVPRSAFYLLRPDGYVGLCGARWDAGAATRYVSERLTLRRSGT